MRRSFQILTIVTTLCLAVTAKAQVAVETLEAEPELALETAREAKPEQTARAQTDYWTRSLGLTRAQAEQLSALNLTFASAARAISRGQATDVQKVQAIESADQQREEDVLAILTEEQRARYLEFMQKRDLWVQQHIQQKQ